MVFHLISGISIKKELKNKYQLRLTSKKIDVKTNPTFEHLAGQIDDPNKSWQTSERLPGKSSELELGAWNKLQVTEGHHTSYKGRGVELRLQKN